MSPSPPVQPEKIVALERRMQELGIREEDIEEQFIRGAGAGGQKINKTSSTVRLRHRPTGLEVRCQQSRSRALNRFLARRRLVDKIDALMSGKKSAEQQNREKIRRQKRKRSKRAKEKMLVAKHQQSEKKALRRPPSPDE